MSYIFYSIYIRINSLNLKIKRKKYSSKFLRVTKNKNKVICLGEVNLINKNIIIGENVVIYPNVSFEGEGLIEIGNNVLIGSNVLITDHAHGTSTIEDLNIPPSRRNLISKGPVIIRDNVWIGENVCILPNVTIGEGAIIGANSVVTKVVPPFSLCCGNPAKVIKTITVEG